MPLPLRGICPKSLKGLKNDIIFFTGFLLASHHLLCHSLVLWEFYAGMGLHVHEVYKLRVLNTDNPRECKLLKLLLQYKCATQLKLNAYSKAGCKNKTYYSIKTK